jgi:hypothetical protein
MDLLAMLIELPLQGSHRRCRVPGQSRSANRKVLLATGALAVQPRFVVLGDMEVWLPHVSSMAQPAFKFQTAKKQSGPLPHCQSCCFPLVRNTHDRMFPIGHSTKPLCSLVRPLAHCKTGTDCESHGGQYCSVI